MDDAKQIMHERFWELRKDRNLTLEQLEKQTGISKSALGSYEAEGTKDISHWAVVRLAEFYGVTTDYLLGLSVMKNHPNADLNDLRLSDKMIELLKSGRINKLCELAAHGDFRRVMLDLEIYVDRIASIHIRNNNTALKTERKVLMERAGLDDNDLNMRTLELVQIDEDDYFAHTIFENLRPIIRDIREAHKSDVTTSDADTESSAEKAVRQLEAALNCEGSKEEKIVRALLSQLEIDYDTLTKEEFVTLIGILNKSEHMKKHISRRGKVPATQRRKRKKR